MRHRLLLGSQRHPRQLFETLHDLQSTAAKMAASGNKRKRDLLTEEDISKVLDKEAESEVFSEESDEFSSDTSEKDSVCESDTSSVVHES
jgi:hypothetical protein